MILFSWPVDQIVVDFTLPGHWRNTVFVFIIDSITFLDSSPALFCFFVAVFFCLLKYGYWAEFTQPLGRLNPACSFNLLRAYWLLLANRSERMPAH